MNNGEINRTTQPKINMELLRSEITSSCDKNLEELIKTIKQTADDYSENQDKLSPVEKWEMRRFLEEGRKLYNQLKRKKLLITNAESVLELDSLYRSFIRQIKTANMKISKSHVEQLIDSIFKY